MTIFSDPIHRRPLEEFNKIGEFRVPLAGEWFVLPAYLNDGTSKAEQKVVSFDVYEFHVLRFKDETIYDHISFLHVFDYYDCGFADQWYCYGHMADVISYRINYHLPPIAVPFSPEYEEGVADAMGTLELTYMMKDDTLPL